MIVAVLGSSCKPAANTNRQMPINTNLDGRVGNTQLPRKDCLLPLFEAVVNSIQSIDEGGAKNGKITVEIIRSTQSSLLFEDDRPRRGAVPHEPITGFRITDDGIGFNEDNMASFETLDSNYKAQHGCRGVGRLLWLKAFARIDIVSTFLAKAGGKGHRTFSFTTAHGVEGGPAPSDVEPSATTSTSILLSGYHDSYRAKCPKTAKTIADSLLEHCLWYFVRDGGAPKIVVQDGDEEISLDDVFNEHMLSSATRESLELKGHVFELTHIKLKSNSMNKHYIAWCAASRVVEQEGLVGKLHGLHGKIREAAGEYFYACYVTSQYLNQRVRPERIGFDIEEVSDGLFSEFEPSMSEIRKAVLASAGSHLRHFLDENIDYGRTRVERFVSRRAPRYRPVLGRLLSNPDLDVDPDLSDKDLELLLHRLLSELESNLLSEGHDIMTPGEAESASQYQTRLASYLAKASDIKNSDLAGYVFHRKVILDILAQAIQRGPDGKYAKEDVIHELIMPMRKTSNEVRMDSCNLWLIDERLAFHNFLASDKPLAETPILDTDEAKEPDLFALNVYDEPILVSEGARLPLASIVVIEIKRPMRNDAAAGEKKDPIEQALGYLERIREGSAKTATGRPIPESSEIPGYCYIICDITPSIKRRCALAGLTVTSDHGGFFGYNQNYRAYIEVISFDRLLNAAGERNRAFFDKLGLPT